MHDHASAAHPLFPGGTPLGWTRGARAVDNVPRLIHDANRAAQNGLGRPRTNPTLSSLLKCHTAQLYIYTSKSDHPRVHPLLNRRATVGNAVLHMRSAQMLHRL